MTGCLLPLTLELADEEATVAFAGRVARALQPAPATSVLIGLVGELGAGKTSWARGLLRALGVSGAIRSPTYTLSETYEAAGLRIVHLDLYRLGSADELEQLGLRDELQPGHVLLVEWPDKGAGALPPQDIELRIEFAGEGRTATLRPLTGAGTRLTERIELV